MSEIKGFGDSAYIAQLHAPAPQHLVEAELAKLLSLLGEDGPAFASRLSETLVPKVAFVELQVWNRLLEPNNQRDRLGTAAARFFAAQALVASVMRPSALDVTATYPPEVKCAMQAGADGLFKFGQPQFEELANVARDLADWIVRRKTPSVALIESPTGNTVPVQVISDLLRQRGVEASTILWNAPRNDRPSRGRTVTDSARDCASDAKNFELVILIDDALSGTRLLKLFDALAPEIGPKRLLPIAMFFRDASRPDLDNHPNRKRLLHRLREQQENIGYEKLWRDFPVLPLFKLDWGPPCRWQCPVIWGDSDMIAGKRKVNFIFAMLCHCFDILQDLATPNSVFRPYLEKAWSQNTVGKGFAFSAELLETAFRNIAADLRLPEFREVLRKKAEIRFPDDYTGNIELLEKDGAEQRWRWLAETFLTEGKSRIEENRAGMAWNAFTTSFSASFPGQGPRPRRDEDAAQYVLPFNDTIRAFNEQLRARIAALVAAGT